MGKVVLDRYSTGSRHISPLLKHKELYKYTQIFLFFRDVIIGTRKDELYLAGEDSQEAEH